MSYEFVKGSVNENRDFNKTSVRSNLYAIISTDKVVKQRLNLDTQVESEIASQPDASCSH